MLLNDNPDPRKDITSCSILLSEGIIESVENRISSSLKLKSVIALVLLYKRKLPESVKTKKEPSSKVYISCKDKLIDLKEIQTVEMELTKLVF